MKLKYHNKNKEEYLIKIPISLLTFVNSYIKKNGQKSIYYAYQVKLMSITKGIK